MLRTEQHFTLDITASTFGLTQEPRIKVSGLAWNQPLLAVRNDNEHTTTARLKMIMSDLLFALGTLHSLRRVIEHTTSFLFFTASYPSSLRFRNNNTAGKHYVQQHRVFFKLAAQPRCVHRKDEYGVRFGLEWLWGVWDDGMGLIMTMRREAIYRYFS